MKTGSGRWRTPDPRSCRTAAPTRGGGAGAAAVLGVVRGKAKVVEVEAVEVKGVRGGAAAIWALVEGEAGVVRAVGRVGRGSSSSSSH